MRVRRLLALVLVSTLALGTAACGGESAPASEPSPSVDTGDTISGLTVSGRLGSPTVKVDAPLKLDGVETEVLSAGDGDPVVTNHKAMFDLLLANGTTGATIYSSAEQGAPEQVSMSDGQFFKVVVDALVGKPTGSRVAVAAPVNEVWGEGGAPQLKLKASDIVVFLVDLLSVAPTTVLDGPQGTKISSPDDAPRVVETDGKVTGFDWSTAPKQPPKKLQVIPLIDGKGPVVKSGRLVTFDYYGAVWGQDKAFDSSYSRGVPAAFGVGVNSLIPAWDKSIPGLRRGSRVLIVAPPGQAYGSQPQQEIPANSTLAFVVDILGVDS